MHSVEETFGQHGVTALVRIWALVPGDKNVMSKNLPLWLWVQRTFPVPGAGLEGFTTLGQLCLDKTTAGYPVLPDNRLTRAQYTSQLNTKSTSWNKTASVAAETVRYLRRVFMHSVVGAVSC